MQRPDVLARQADFLTKEFPDESKWIASALDLLCFTLENLLKGMKEKIADSQKNGERDKSMELSKIAEHVSNLKDAAREYLVLLTKPK